MEVKATQRKAIVILFLIDVMFFCQRTKKSSKIRKIKEEKKSFKKLASAP